MVQLALRCYTRRNPDGQYDAVCLDLNLADQRETVDAAMTALDESILLYLESVRARGDQATAIPRPAPRAEWLECYWLLLANAVLGLFGRRMDGFSTYAKQGILTATQELRLAYALDVTRPSPPKKLSLFCLPADSCLIAQLAATPSTAERSAGNSAASQ